MRLIFYWFSFIVLFTHSINGQILELSPRLFSLRNAKLSLGVGVDGNFVGNNNKTGLNKFIGRLPSEYTIVYDTMYLPSANYSLYFDLYSPNSRIGLVFSGIYGVNKIMMESPTNNFIMDLRRIEGSMLLKFKMGKINTAVNPILLLGGAYSIPIQFDTRGHNPVPGDISLISNTFYAQWGMVFQINFKFRDKAFVITDNTTPNQQPIRISYPRLWVFYKGSQLMNNLFSTDTSYPIIPGTMNSDLYYRDLNHTMGLAFFLGSKVN